MSVKPSDFGPKILQDITDRVAEGQLLKDVCSLCGYPSTSTVRRWVIDDSESFAAGFTRARELGIHAMIDDCVQISDDSARDTITNEKGDEIPNNEWIQRSRLRVDTRKWLASKIVPKVYGERTQQEISGPDGGAIIVRLESPLPKIEI